jgi:hypothetical protein
LRLWWSSHLSISMRWPNPKCESSGGLNWLVYRGRRSRLAKQDRASTPSCKICSSSQTQEPSLRRNWHLSYLINGELKHERTKILDSGLKCATCCRLRENLAILKAAIGCTTVTSLKWRLGWTRTSVRPTSKTRRQTAPSRLTTSARSVADRSMRAASVYFSRA